MDRRTKYHNTSLGHLMGYIGASVRYMDLQYQHAEDMGQPPPEPKPKSRRERLKDYGLHPTKGYGWASRRGKRSNG